jgi:hypothetical protein
VLVYLLAIMGLMSFFLVSSYYRDNVIRMTPQQSTGQPRSSDEEKLPGGGTSRKMPFESPYHREGGR